MKKLFSILLLIFLTIPSFSQEEDINNSLLWEISGNGIKSPSYLFGTIHIIPEKDYFFTNKMKESFDKCNTLALEIDINIPLLKQIEIAKKVIIPNNKTLEDYMSPQEFESFKIYMLDSLKVKENRFKQIQKIKPIFSMSIILSDMIKNPVAYEQKLNKMANKNDMDIVGLETVEYQMKILDSIDIQSQVYEFCIKNHSSNPIHEYNQMLDIYLKQDINKLYNLTSEDEFVKKIETNLLITRNKNWIPLIINLISKDPTFIAVGSAHLGGENGILEQLKREGYTLIPIK